MEGLGHEVIVADPNFAPMYATCTRKVKTDRTRPSAGRAPSPAGCVVEDPTDYGNLRIATLKDPEGNLVQLLEPLKT